MGVRCNDSLYLSGLVENVILVKKIHWLLDYGCYCVLFIYPEKNGKDEIGGVFVFGHFVDFAS